MSNIVSLAEYGASLAAQLPPLTDDEAEHAARVIAAMQMQQKAQR